MSRSRPTLFIALFCALSGNASAQAVPSRQVTGKIALSGPAGSRAQAKPWVQGQVYHLQALPNRISTIVLQPGEKLLSVAAGDTARWVIGDTTSGAGASARTVLMIKPAASGLRTNLLVSTDRRLYEIELASLATGTSSSLSWSYPEDSLLALSVAAARLADAVPMAAEQLNFSYRVSGHHPAWRPLRAFDDGKQTFIQFPADLGSADAPPLFIIGPSGGLELVNYRLRGRYYVVDRLFDTAELRLGAKKQSVVRITREGRGGRS